MNEILKRIDNLNLHYKEKENERKILEEQKIEQYKLVEEIDQQLLDIITEKVLLENSSLEALNLSKDIMEEVSTSSLRAVFDDDREVVIKLGNKSGQRSAELLMVQNGDDTDPSCEEGGGVADIVSLTSFIALGDLSRDNHAPLFLDEPNKYLSEEYSEKMALYLKDILEYTGKQIFLVTHDDFLKTVGDTVFKVRKTDKNSEIEAVINN